MTELRTPPALRVALAYHDAWVAHDFDRAMTFISPQIVCSAPAGEIVGADAFRAFMEPFSRITRAAHVIGAFGDETTAVVLYDTETAPVPHAPGAEHLRVSSGVITELTLVFDRLPFAEARKAAV